MHRLDRLENPTKAHQTIPGRQGHRPLRYEADAPVTTLRQLAPRSETIATDAFSLNWATLRGYAFPPFNLIPRTLIKVLKDKTTIVLVAPVWQGQTWWPLLLQLAISQPVRLPSTPETLKNPIDPTMTHPMFPRLHLAVWLVSSDRALAI